MSIGAFQTQARLLKEWTLKAALPFWAQTAIDDRHGFYEALDLDGRPLTQAIRRVRVQSRQIYVYARAAKLDWYDGLSIAQNTFDFMCDTALGRDPQAGFVHRLNPDYSVNSDMRDFYDHAFHLLACATLLQNGPHPGARNLINEISALLTTWESPYGGWQEGSTQNLPRRQNPHMHALEAFMALYDATGDSQYLDMAKTVFDLFEQLFYDSQHIIIREFFTQDWQISDGLLGDTSEPGHSAEWVWLLWEFEKRTGYDSAHYAQKLYSKLHLPAIFLNDETHYDGTPRRQTKRLWVQTELIKAHIAQSERGDATAISQAARAMQAFRETYLIPDGTWVDQINADGAPCATTIPTSSFYHIFCMVSEANRLSEIWEKSK